MTFGYFTNLNGREALAEAVVACLFFAWWSAPREWPGPSFLNLHVALLKQGEAHALGGVGVIDQSEPQRKVLEVNNKLGGVMKAVAE